MKTLVLTAAALVLSTTATLAAPRYEKNHRGVSNYERVMIMKSAARLSALKRRAWRDGRLTQFERFQIRNAERSHYVLVARAHRRG